MRKLPAGILIVLAVVLVLQRLPVLAASYDVNMGLLSLINHEGNTQSLALLERAAIRRPADSRARWYLGYLLLLTGKTDQAVETWRLSKEAPERLAWLAEVGIDQEDPERALEWLNLALRITPNSAALWNRSGDVLASMQDWISAQGAYQKAIFFDPNNAAFYADYANALMADRANYTQAEAVLAQANQLAPGDEAVLRSLASLAEHRSDLQQAIRWWQLAVEAPQSSLDTLLHLGLAYEQAGMPEQAVETYRQAVKRAPDVPTARTALARAYLLNGQWQLAAAEADRAVRQTPQDTEAWLVLGKAQLAGGERLPAIQALNRVLSLDPDNQEALALLEILGGQD